MIKIAMLGAAGRMGQTIIRCMARNDGFTLIGAVDAEGHPSIGQDAGSVAGAGALSVPITADAQSACASADVLIDFSFHAAVPDHARLAAETGRPMVIGTTGLTDDELAAVNDAAQQIAVMMAPNMSLGVNLLFALTQKAASVLGTSYDAEIIDVHHRHKKDAPSGTALRLGEKLAIGRDQNFEDVVCYGRAGDTGERPEGQIGIHALRSGDAIGDHVVSFATEGERIELAHSATSRDAFANGALHAARWVTSEGPGLYDMQDVLGLA